jgi:hypothetical protein
MFRWTEKASVRKWLFGYRPAGNKEGSVNECGAEYFREREEQI